MNQSIAKLSLLAGITVCGMALLAGCHSGKIPVDEKKAQEHVITEAKAKEYIRSFADGTVELQRQIRDSQFLNSQFNLPIAEAFNRDAIGALLNAEGAAGIRIYLGRDSSGQVRLVLIPVTKDGRDIYTRLVGGVDANANGVSAAPQTQSIGQAMEDGQRCPTLCNPPLSN
jgi:hypothetical protein